MYFFYTRAYSYENSNDPGLCVSVSVRPRLRGIHIWYRALCKSAPVHHGPRVERSILRVNCY